MSQRDVERTLGRLLTDQGFREEFFLDPAHACLQAGVQLTPHEVEALVRVPRPALARLGARLDDRICRLHIPQSDVSRQEEWGIPAVAPPAGRAAEHRGVPGRGGATE